MPGGNTSGHIGTQDNRQATEQRPCPHHPLVCLPSCPFPGHCMHGEAGHKETRTESSSEEITIYRVSASMLRD